MRGENYALPMKMRETTRGLSVVVIVVIPVAIVPVPVDIVDKDADTSVGAAANSRADRRGVAPGADYGERRHLRNEDEVALGIRRHRVRAGRLRDGLNKDARPVDHTEPGPLGRPTRGRAIALGPRA